LTKEEANKEMAEYNEKTFVDTINLNTIYSDLEILNSEIEECKGKIKEEKKHLKDMINKKKLMESFIDLIFATQEYLKEEENNG